MIELEAPAPRFSVVIAAFNAAQWIVPTVRSALGQTYRSAEIIVVGDGCTDDTGQVLAANFGDAIRWTNLHRNSGGQSAPNNEGIRLSRGTHVAYLGHDDIWSPRHLERLSEVIADHDPDFAVSGAVFHTPPGSQYYQITGIFDDPACAATEFFPPSSFAHRRDVAQRIGFWRDPAELRAPADCDFLLRAVAHECTFASTGAITVHKFAAGHRYLSYRLPSADEQSAMLDRLSEEGGEERVLDEIRRAIDEGADHPPIRYPDFESFGAGELLRRNRSVKGLDKGAPVAIGGTRWLPVDAFAAGLDWYDIEERDLLGRFRWSGPNPHPRFLLNVRAPDALRLRIHVLAFASTEIAQALKLAIDGREVPFVRARNFAGSDVLTVDRVAGPIEDGMVLEFRMPHGARLSSDPAQRRVGLALRGVEVTPLA